VDGADLGQWLVSNGLALDWPNYSRGMYDKNQREAEHAGAACGRAATSPRGCTGSASEPVEGQPIAQMTRTPIRDGQRETAPFASAVPSAHYTRADRPTWLSLRWGSLPAIL
jgi:hypothetical protein